MPPLFSKWVASGLTSLAGGLIRIGAGSDWDPPCVTFQISVTFFVQIILSLRVCFDVDELSIQDGSTSSPSMPAQIADPIEGVEQPGPSIND